MMVAKKKPARKAAAKRPAAKKRAASRAGQMILIAPKKPAVKRVAARKAATKRRNPAPAKHRLQVRKTAKGAWSTLLESTSVERLKSLAQMYANNYPKYWFQVI